MALGGAVVCCGGLWMLRQMWQEDACRCGHEGSGQSWVHCSGKILTISMTVLKDTLLYECCPQGLGRTSCPVTLHVPDCNMQLVARCAHA